VLYSNCVNIIIMQDSYWSLFFPRILKYWNIFEVTRAVNPTCRQFLSLSRNIHRQFSQCYKTPTLLWGMKHGWFVLMMRKPKSDFYLSQVSKQKAIKDKLCPRMYPIFTKTKNIPMDVPRVYKNIKIMPMDVPYFYKNIKIMPMYVTHF